MDSCDNFPFELTAHARFALAERGIKAIWVLRVLTNPDRVDPDGADPDLRHALGAIEEHEGRVLRVVYNHRATPWRIVTAFFDRRERRRV